MKQFARITGAVVLCTVMGTAALAQSADTIVVFDGSGSMWGQIDGRTKIEIARDTLSSVLTQLPSQTRIGMIAYGHREKGVCADIETVVPVGLAGQAVPRMIDAANALKPKGKTPLSDAVRIAAEQLKYTENAATVVLVTDGIETCDADPCALATELENAGIDFTTHVVGFGLSQEEGRQVQCLADNTGGLYLAARNAGELTTALRQAVQTQPIEPDPSDFEPLETTRSVRFIFRDTPESPQIGTRELSGHVERLNTGERIEDADFAFSYPEAQGNSATGQFEPGRYVGIFHRDGGSSGGYDVRYEFEVPDGDGEYVIEASLSGSLTINAFINPKLRYEDGDPFPSAVGGSRPRIHFEVFPVDNGEVANEPVGTGQYNATFALSPGQYLIRGNIDSGTSAERLVEVKAGEATEFDFSFDATRVFVDARETSGAPVKRQTTYWYDKMRSGRNYWTSGNSQTREGLKPFYLPTGTWLLNTGGEGYGARRSEVLVTVPGDYQDMRLEIGESRVLSDQDIAFLNERGEGCLKILKVGYTGCLVERADLTTGEPKHDPMLNPAPMPSYLIDLDGLGGTAYTFKNSDNGRMAYIVFDPAFGEDALMVLQNDWCATGNCAGRRVRVPASRIDSFQNDVPSSGSFYTDDFELAYSVFGAESKTLFVTPNGQSRLRFDLDEVITLSNSPAPAPAPKPDPGQAQAGLEGLTGTAYAFVDENQEPKLHIVFAPGDTENATVVLSAAWCGSAKCEADRFPIEYDEVDLLLDDKFGASAAGANSYSIDISSFGEEKEAAVSGAGASRVRFTLMDKIDLGGSAQTNEKQTEQAQQATLSDEVNRIFGVFRLYDDERDVASITSDYFHVDNCRRGQTIIWPDGLIAIKQFEEPQGPDENPFKLVASGQCRIDRSRYECRLSDPAGTRSEQLNFTSEALGNNHYRLQNDGENAPTLAASCFWPGGEVDANMETPVGATMAELILERPDGKEPGMGFDRNNNAFRGQQ